MAIKYWAPRHRTTLYNAFDKVRLNNFAILEANFVSDMLDQKITQKAQRRIEDEWVTYWCDMYEEEPEAQEKLLVHRINKSEFLLILSLGATEIAKRIHEQDESYISESEHIVE